MTATEVYEETMRLLNTAMVNWREAANLHSKDDLHAVSQQCDAIIEKATRLRAYVEGRGGRLNPNDLGHEQAVKLSNRLCEKVRRVLGYSYPKHDVTF
jgi:hypothetical protein